MPVSDHSAIEELKPDFCYQNNIKLKKGNVTLPYTLEQIREIQKCIEPEGIFYFLSNYVYIVNVDKGLVLFEPYEFQKEIIRTCLNNRFSVFLISRQNGKTTTVASYLLWEAIFRSHHRIAILANKAETAREILSRIAMMYEELPWFIKPGVLEWNKGSIVFDNDSRIFASSTSSSAIRGRSVSILYLDEFAFVSNDVEFYTSTYPTITSGKTTKVIITSTPKGLNLFHKIWVDAVKGRNQFVCKKFLWNDHPERDEKWKEQTMKNMSEQQFRQEYLCEFIGSSDTLISGNKLEQMTYELPIRTEGNLRIYEFPKEQHTYILVADISEGVGKDNSAFSVIDISSVPYVQVAAFHNNILSPYEIASIIYQVAMRYNEAYVLIENNGPGKITIDMLFYEYEYENMINNLVDTNLSTKTKRGMLGIRTTGKTKKIGCVSLKSFIESDVLIIKDYETIQELSTFSRKGNSYSAESGKNDDLVMTLVIFSWFMSQEYASMLTERSMKSIMKEKIDDQMILGFLDTGIDDQYDDSILELIKEENGRMTERNVKREVDIL